MTYWLQHGDVAAQLEGEAVVDSRKGRIQGVEEVKAAIPDDDPGATVMWTWGAVGGGGDRAGEAAAAGRPVSLSTVARGRSYLDEFTPEARSLVASLFHEAARAVVRRGGRGGGGAGDAESLGLRVVEWVLE
eukprot:CAMPEP_0182895652 /NCGR_PEP_ID=MMETSP0034_2-20130328/25810_1 /TAXON_ID=156128 /ORGANISM="Nephroselmis pyriformis, Strain CCMP717" /LENGTH=131 /DNA_ID=CAMNT_0025029489 /DNA_START=43 /DNA_END=435 /DNA_ORIENTATION=-